MDVADVTVRRGQHRLHVEITDGPGTPLVLMHGFPDSTRLYDRVLPYLTGRRRVVRFDFLGWGRSDKPAGYPYTATNQVDDLDAVVASLPDASVVLVAHDASGPPAIDWALDHPDRVEALVLLNTYYHWMPGLRRPPAIALYSTPVVGAVARGLTRRWPDLDRRLYEWQVGGFIRDAAVRDQLLPRLYEEFWPARPAFRRLNQDLLGTVLSRRRRVAELRRFPRPVRVIFGARDRYLNAGVARRFAGLFPDSELHLLETGGHYVQVDEPARVAELLLRS
jgi:haloalkane dehalogenase